VVSVPPHLGVALRLVNQAEPLVKVRRRMTPVNQQVNIAVAGAQPVSMAAEMPLLGGAIE
jgi:hypothetical protein